LHFLKNALVVPHPQAKQQQPPPPQPPQQKGPFEDAERPTCACRPRQKPPTPSSAKMRATAAAALASFPACSAQTPLT
jgi:hypothetical protein